MSETKNLKLFKHDEPLESNENIFDIDKSLSKNWDKLDEYSVGIDTKIQALETDNTKNKKDISDIQTEQGNQNTNIELLQKENEEIKEENSRLKEDLNAFPTTSGSGEYVTLDTADSRFKELKNCGNSKQETRSGRNLFNLDYIGQSTSKVVTDTGVNLINCWGSEAFSNANVLQTFKPNTTYTMKAKAKVISRPSNMVFHKYDAMVLYRAGSASFESVATSILTIPDKETIALNTKKEYITTFKTPANLTDVRLLTYTFYGNNDGSTTGAALGEIDLSEIMIVEGNYTADTFPEYEQYGAMPSAEFPSEIRNVGDNGNLYNKDNPNVLDTPIDSNGLGGNIKNTYKTVWIKCKSNTTYTVSKKYDATKNRFALAYTSEEPNYSQQVEGYTSNMHASSLTIKTNSTAKYLLVYVWIAGGSVTYQEMLDSIKIEKGTQATLDNGHGLGSMEIIICNKNILNQDLELFQGSYDNNGNVITNPDRRIDKYIFLAKGNYILWSTINNWINVLIYNKNKKLLSVKNSNTNKEIAFTLDEDGYIRFGFNPTVESLKVFQLERTTEKTTSEEHKQQIIVFPFKKGQRLMEGDYLAEDGIHHKRKQIILDEKSLIRLYNHDNIDPDMQGFYVSIDGVILNSKIVSSHFKNDSLFKTKESRIYCYQNNTIHFIVDKTVADNIDNLKAYIAAQKEAGTPVLIEYGLAEEEVESYTEAQKEAWKQIENAKSYEGQTNIFSNNDVSPVFEVTARRDLNAILNSLQSQILAD